MANQYGNVTVRGDGMLLTILELVTCGVNESVGEKEALDIGRKVVESIRHTFGGEVVYVCKGRSIDAIMLSNQIWAEFTGDNHVELSKKFGCSVQWIYTVVRTMTKVKRDEVQGDLFDSEKGQGPNDKGPSLC
ncbi:transcriptional regulator [Pseudoalteromonas sp. MMG013]|uniref:Mor transcription activator family protein n=1 Tax=unclassified Pseudoalteromonas TaxID=194690 RepID=UPI001B394AE7|nr:MULTISPECIES: Mor transcription activator family protein [unclassified Pseudoalteromonas]MBQ4851025.1 transcriptional regulator [Pseudoalteromonas sp. MMG012]MBQ4860477.1 transcriptional regulator [Pseudoalteromonas sp. MMG013]